jgi:hypothetical protein
MILAKIALMTGDFLGLEYNYSEGHCYLTVCPLAFVTLPQDLVEMAFLKCQQIFKISTGVLTRQ